MGRKIIILGTGEGFENCPFDKETWAIGKVLLMVKDHKGNALPKGYHSKISKLFNIDDLSQMLTFNHPAWKTGWTREKYFERINKLNIPLITSFYCKELNKCEEFPLKKVVETFGNYYFTNTICYMIAYAMLEEVDEIDLWGVNQVGMKEYINERKGVEFWMGLAGGSGIKFDIKGGFSALLKLDKGILYGYKRPFNELIDYFDIKYDGRID